MTELPDGVTVEEWNDALAAEHDIDDYYERASPLVRAVERRRLRAIRSLIGPAPGERLVEIGCGGGHVLALFPECELVGVDVSGAMLDKARVRLSGLRAELHKGELDEVGLEPAGFDAAICTEVLEHVVDPDCILAGIHRLLKPGGRVVVTFPNDALINRGKRIVKKSGLARLAIFEGIDWGGDRYHINVWTIAGMRNLVASHFELDAEAHVPSRLTPVRSCFLGRRKVEPVR